MREPPSGACFGLELDGVEVGHFLGCSGLEVAATPYEVVEGGVNHRVHRFVGAPRPARLVLRAGIAATDPLRAWCAGVHDDEGGSRQGAITVYDAAGAPLARFGLVGAWPERWQGPRLDADASEVAVEEVVVVVAALRPGG